MVNPTRTADQSRLCVLEAECKAALIERDDNRTPSTARAHSVALGKLVTERTRQERAAKLTTLNRKPAARAQA